MLFASCSWRHVAMIAVIAVATIVGAAFASSAAAQTVDVALNVQYTTPGDTASGGIWRLIARTSATGGISSVGISLSPGSLVGMPQLAGPSGIVNGSRAAGFSELDIFQFPDQHVELVIGQIAIVGTPPAGQEQSIFYGAGKIANGSPNFSGKPVGSNSIGPNFTTLTDAVRIPWATSIESLGEMAWETAVGLATGAFAPGSTPSILDGQAVVFTSVGTASTLGTTSMVVGASFNVLANRIVAGVAGDYNGNGIVDAADYTVWRNNNGTVFQLTNEGPDTPGEVTIEDYNFWKANFGNGAPPPGGGSTAGGNAGLGGVAVPEPTALALWLGACGVIVLRPKRRTFRQISPSMKKLPITIETA
jgi:hypothetical protein